MRSDRLRRGALFIAGLALVAAASAMPPELRDLIGRLPPAAQAQVSRNAAQWEGWSAQQREAFRRRAAQWDALPRAERDERRERYLAWKSLPPSERSQIQAAAAHFAALPPDLQHGWRAQFDALDRSERRGWLLGPSLGADYATLQPLLAQVPEQEHERLLRTLRAMTPQERRDLGVLAQRTPPAQREALRSELLAVNPQDRRDWLWARLQR